MNAIDNPFLGFIDTAQRGYGDASEAFSAWTGAASAAADAAESQARSLRQIVTGLLDLADQAVELQREMANYLTISARTTATAIDGWRQLTDAAFGTAEAVTGGFRQGR